MIETAITRYILDTFSGVETTENFGYTFFFFGSERMLPMASIASSDNEYDRVSNLDRPDVFRLNLGISRETFRSLFGGRLDLNSYDFTALDTLMPHPHYSQQYYVCILNPSKSNSEMVKRLLKEAYELAVTRENKHNQTA